MTTEKKRINFLVIIEAKPPIRDFSLKDLPGASKIDVVARNILTLFPNRNKDLKITYYALFSKENPHILKVKELCSKISLYDEIEIASLLKEKIQTPMDTFTIDSYQQKNDINWFQNTNLETFLKIIPKDETNIYYLHERGKSYENFLETFETNKNFLFILGGRHDVSEENEKIINEFNIQRINLGKISYLASTCLLKIVFEFEKILEK
ncbi:MAG TPA: hypothetical protein VMX55_11465 [candidate division Zixibacteria bacterium]|nr:hypothetical protein [candidate division Zixibacteria bacterium]